jgi:hypothetical protein
VLTLNQKVDRCAIEKLNEKATKKKTVVNKAVFIALVLRLMPESGGCYATEFEKVTKGGKDFLKKPLGC